MTALTEPDTIEAFFGRIVRAWNRGDASAYAREFTGDASYVIFLGDLLSGRDEIERTHIDVLTKWQANTSMRIEIVTVTMLDHNTASVLTVGGIADTAPIRYDKFQTFTLVRRDGRWQCAAFQNTQMSEQSTVRWNGTG